MTETEAALFDAVGPRAQRRIRVFTVLSVLVLLGLLALAYWQFYRSGQLAPSRWATLYQPSTIGYFVRALGHTGWAALAAGALALPLGLLLAVGRLSRRWLLRWPATAVIEVFRAVPVLLIIYIFTSALPQYGINPEVFWKLVIPIGLCAAAVIAEVIRAGVLALPRGQSDAAAAIGLTGGQAFRIVVLPQAIRMIVPSLVAQAVIVVKDTTFGYVVSYNELMQSGRVLVATTGDLVQTYLVITVVYILVNIAISRAAQRLDAVLAARRTGTRRRFLPIFPARAAAGAGVGAPGASATAPPRP
ncbi:amino acid ABC transporter permease [Georgenia sp. TF02-10]|uniref:amino acid ABC transporter permease n=1 Tax=Georgenia sp. TF02-10 TaxID=2917725 RepID=UPI001FA7C212|nr:amino acid ABC transporter permease [Georgenia sp. TF02-10]UNX55302.1 amino acid ABC transporter permease [Georgenia sp. TF02-10]